MADADPMFGKDEIAGFVRDTQEKVRLLSKGKSPAEKRRIRVDHGMCPACGKEAAPYYLCHDCRTSSSFRRMLNTMAQRGILTKSKKGSSSLWSVEKGKAYAEVGDFNWGTYLLEMDPGKRPKPRIGRRPIDLDETLFGIFTDAGKPLSLEEVYLAWGRLRSKRKTETLAGDMTAIIKAQRKREARAAKRAQGISTDTAKTAQPVEGEACEPGAGTACAQTLPATDQGR